MPRRSLLCGSVVAILTLTVAAGCDGGGGTPKQSPSANGSSAASPSASPSPSPTVSQNEMMLHAAQEQFKAYYKLYLVEGKDPESGPSKSLLGMTDPYGPERDALKKSFVAAKDASSKVVSPNVSITVGPEQASNGSKRTELKFRACIDARKVKVTDEEGSGYLSWELLDISMRTKDGASADSRSRPSSWRVYRANQVDADKPCEL